MKAGLAEDKMFLRDNLSKGAENALVKNYNYLPILETEIVKFFEIGSVFFDGREEKHLVIVCAFSHRSLRLRRFFCVRLTSVRPFLLCCCERDFRPLQSTNQGQRAPLSLGD